MIPVELRPMMESDIGYIVDTIINCAKQPIYAQMKVSVYISRYKPIILRILRGAQTTIACPAGQPDTIAGYVIYDRIDRIPIIHWIQVRGMFQGQGLAAKLARVASPDFGNSLTVVSHLPKSQNLSDLKDKYRIQYDPFLFLQG